MSVNNIPSPSNFPSASSIENQGVHSGSQSRAAGGTQMPGAMAMAPGLQNIVNDRRVGAPARMPVPSVGEVLLGTWEPRSAAVRLAERNLQIAENSFSVQVPGMSGQGKINREMLPEGLRNHPDLDVMVENKIAKGANEFKEIITTKPHQMEKLLNMSAADKATYVSDISFFLQARGEGKVGMSFEQGTFSLPDPHGSLARFLASCPGAEQQDTEYLIDIQNSTRSSDPSKPGTEHYAVKVDANDSSLATCLPYGKNSLVFGRLPSAALSESGTAIPQDRLFVRVEREISNESRVDQALNNPPGRTRGLMGKIKGFFRAIGSFFSGLFSSRTSHLSLIAPKFNETLPKGILSNYKHVINKCGNREMKNILRSGDYENPGKGLRVIAKNIEQLRRLHGRDIARDSSFETALAGFCGRFLDANNPKLDHLHMRMGREVILTAEDIALASPVHTMQPLDTRVIGRFEKSGQSILEKHFYGLTDGETEPGKASNANRHMMKSDDEPIYIIKPNGERVLNADPVLNDPNLDNYFVTDITRYAIQFEGAGMDAPVINTRDEGFKASGGELTPYGHSQVQGFFSGPFNGDVAAGEKAKRAVTSVAHQGLYQFFYLDALAQDPGGHTCGRSAFPVPPRYGDVSQTISSNPDGTFNVQYTMTRKNADQVSAGNKEGFGIGSSNAALGRDFISLDYDKSDYGFEFVLKIDPKATDPNAAPSVSVVRASGFSELYSKEGDRLI